MSANFGDELQNLINAHSVDADTSTPDFILAEFLIVCVQAWRDAVKARDDWYGLTLWPGRQQTVTEVTEPDADPEAGR